MAFTCSLVTPITVLAFAQHKAQPGKVVHPCQTEQCQSALRAWVSLTVGCTWVAPWCMFYRHWFACIHRARCWQGTSSSHVLISITIVAARHRHSIKLHILRDMFHFTLWPPGNHVQLLPSSDGKEDVFRSLAWRDNMTKPAMSKVWLKFHLEHKNKLRHNSSPHFKVCKNSNNPFNYFRSHLAKSVSALLMRNLFSFTFKI